jgi:2-methylaconitate cis-trans-isomerase PrpF
MTAGALKDDSGYQGAAPHFAGGMLQIPVHHMRGGTSTGVVLFAGHLPPDRALREELIRRLMGVPHEGVAPGNRQITGLGRGIPQSCKVFIVAPSTRDGVHIDSTLAQLAPDKAAIDWSVNCGNMSAALPFYALEVGLISSLPGRNVVRIHNTNTGVETHAVLELPAGDGTVPATTEIPGVIGAWPGVQLSLLSPAGAKTGKLLPTGSPVDDFDGLQASCVDLAVPMVIARAADLGKTARETPEALDADEAFKSRLRELWVAAGLRMGLRAADGEAMTEAALAASETIPKACIVAEPDPDERALGASIRVRYFTPQAGHKSLAVTGGACLAAACLIPGTVARALARDVAPLGPEVAEHVVRLANPAGLLKATIEGKRGADGEIEMPSAAYERSAQTLLRGYSPIYNASDALLAWYRDALDPAA